MRLRLFHVLFLSVSPALCALVNSIFLQTALMPGCCFSILAILLFRLASPLCRCPWICVLFSYKQSAMPFPAAFSRLWRLLRFSFSASLGTPPRAAACSLTRFAPISLNFACLLQNAPLPPGNPRTRSAPCAAFPDTSYSAALRMLRGLKPIPLSVNRFLPRLFLFPMNRLSAHASPRKSRLPFAHLLFV